MAQAQLSFHGHKDAVKFFVAVPGNSPFSFNYKTKGFNVNGCFQDKAELLPRLRMLPSRPNRRRWRIRQDLHRCSYCLEAKDTSTSVKVRISLLPSFLEILEISGYSTLSVRKRKKRKKKKKQKKIKASSCLEIHKTKCGRFLCLLWAQSRTSYRKRRATWLSGRWPFRSNNPPPAGPSPRTETIPPWKWNLKKKKRKEITKHTIYLLQFQRKMNYRTTTRQRFVDTQWSTTFVNSLKNTSQFFLSFILLSIGKFHFYNLKVIDFIPSYRLLIYQCV